jgi:hypothetical protein
MKSEAIRAGSMSPASSVNKQMFWDGIEVLHDRHHDLPGETAAVAGAPPSGKAGRSANRGVLDRDVAVADGFKKVVYRRGHEFAVNFPVASTGTSITLRAPSFRPSA